MNAPFFRIARRRLSPRKCLLTLAVATVLPFAGPASGGTSPVPTGGEIVAAPVATVRTTVVTEPVANGHRQPASRARRSASGFRLADPDLVGITPRGLHVWVAGGTRHAQVIAAYARTTVAQWRRLGLQAQFHGYGSPRQAEGIVTIGESRAGCRGGAAGLAWQRFGALAGRAEFAAGGRVAICPRIFRQERWQWGATIRHELGHLAGLGHFDAVHRGRTQVMRWQNRGGISTYQAGDLRGLRHLAAGRRRVLAAYPPVGIFERSTMSSGDTVVDLVGWAVLPVSPGQLVRIRVTDNGRLVSSARTDVYRPEVNRTQHRGSHAAHGFSVGIPWSGGRHTYCVTAVSPLRSATTANLGCTTWYGE